MSAFDQIAAHDVISFDVFDTLITRAIAHPTDVFAIVKAKLLSTHWALMEASVVDGFPGLRVSAERGARERKLREAGHSEVTLAEIYLAFSERSGASGALVLALQQTELATELQVMRAIPDAASLFAFALAKNKRVIVCSDMYLPGAEICKLLSQCGYHGYDAVFVSAELAASKQAGTMYPLVAQRLGVRPERILHIGDDPHGDQLMARASGWHALAAPRGYDRSTLRSPWNGETHFSPDAVASIVAGLKRIRSNRITQTQPDPWEELGFACFGPLCTGFLLWLRVEIERKRPDRILLFARDGYFLSGILPRFLTGLEPLPRCEYVYASRGSLLLAGMTDFSLERLEHLFSGRRKRALRTHLERLGLDPAAVVTQISTAGFSSLDDDVHNGDPRMKALLANVHQLVLRESARQRSLVQAYLEPFFDDAREVMLIDVGWVGNMQASIARLMQTKRPDLITRGHYFGLFPGAAANALPRHTMHGWLTGNANIARFEQEFWWSGGVELLEFALTAPHGTTLGYERIADGSIAPVLENSIEEQRGAALGQRLQRGALAFIDAFLTAYGDVPAESLNSREWAADFYRVVTNPSRAEAELLGALTHSDSAGETSLRLPLAPAIDGSDGAPAYDEHIYWTSGFVIRNGLDASDAFDENFYLQLYDDVRDAVARGTIASAREHWEHHGRSEGRSASGAEWMRRQRAYVPA